MLWKIEKIIYNLFVGLDGQLITLCLGIILPRLILTSFGSEINGLVSTATQLYTYIAILEAGIGAASLNALYRFFAKNDQDGVSNTLSATKIYFRCISIIYRICVILVTLLFLFVLKTEIDRLTIAIVVLLQGLSDLLIFILLPHMSNLF